MWKTIFSTYDAYAEIYDDMKGDRSSTVQLIVDLIKKHDSAAHSVLDLACGTGGIAQGLAAEGFDVVGLDQSPQMLQIARRKLPGMQFVQGNMADFRLDKQFDVVCCLHNSVNHLTLFREWRALFHNAAAHLRPGGIFIFDINPVSKMNDMAAYGPAIRQVGKDYVITQMLKDDSQDGLYTWDVKILKENKGWYTVKHEPIKVSSHPDDKIRAALQNDYKILESFTPKAPAITDDIDRVYYVCIKK